MKNVKLYATSVLVYVVSLLVAHLPVAAQNLKGNGKMQTQSRNASGFESINVSGGFYVELTQGNSEGIRLEAEENLLDNIATEVKNGALHIYNKESITTSKSMKVFVTVKELNSVDISGGVKVVGNSTFKSNAMKLNMSGGSSVKLALNTKQLKADLSGASKVELAGKADEVNMEMSGASKIEAADLEAKRVKIEASGASKVKVYAKETLDIEASGASVVHYRGAPSITAETSAAARISKL